MFFCLSAAVAGAVGKRSRTIDFKEYTLLLEHLGLYKKMTRFEAHQIFKKANRADDGDGDNAELVLGEFRQCMELIAQHVAEPVSVDILLHSIFGLYATTHAREV